MLNPISQGPFFLNLVLLKLRFGGMPRRAIRVRRPVKGRNIPNRHLQKAAQVLEPRESTAVSSIGRSFFELLVCRHAYLIRVYGAEGLNAKTSRTWFRDRMQKLGTYRMMLHSWTCMLDSVTSVPQSRQNVL